MTNPLTPNDSAFHQLLREQIRHEFTASQQYLAIAVYFDSGRLPQLAQRFYRQAHDERGHALMMVQYLLDRDLAVEVGSLDPVESTFATVRDAVALAVRQEQDVTERVTQLSQTARDSNDYLGERFMHWFLQAQVEEVATMKTLLAIVDRAAGNLFDVEEFVAREGVSASSGMNAPRAAGTVVR